MKILTSEANSGSAILCSHCYNYVEKAVEVTETDGRSSPRLCVKCVSELVNALADEWCSQIRIGSQLIVTPEYKELQPASMVNVGDVYTIQGMHSDGVLVAVKEHDGLMLISLKKPPLHQLALAIAPPSQGTASHE